MSVTHTPDAKQVALHIARSVSVGRFEPIRVPFQLARIPAGTTLSSVYVQDTVGAGKIPWEAGLTLAKSGVTTSVNLMGKPDCYCGGKWETHQNTTVNRHPAWLDRRFGHQSITIYFGHWPTAVAR